MNVRPNDASIFINDKYQGQARDFAGSSRLMVLQPGKYSVSIRREGFVAANFTVKVEAGRTVELDVRLNRGTDGVEEDGPNYQLDLEKTGWLAITAVPDDASLYIDDNYYGIVQDFEDKESAIVLRAGPHKIQIVRPGFKPYISTVEVPSEGTQALTIALEKEGN